MAITATRISSTGTLFVNGIFDEITYNTASTISSGGRYNLISYSNYFAVSGGLGWQSVFPAGATLTTGIDAPDGSLTAVRWSCNNTTNALLRVYLTSFTPDGSSTYTMSFYARHVSGTKTGFSSDLADGVGYTYSAALVTGSWVRITYSGIPTAAGKSFLDLFSDSNTNNVIDYWGVQIEKASSTSVYQPIYNNIVTAPMTGRVTTDTVYVSGLFDEVTNMIITDGLLLYVNGSSGVYSGTGTQWSDLSSYNNNATLTNGPTYSASTGGGSFAFDGSTQYAPITTALLNTTYTGKTVFIVGRMNASAWTPGASQYRAMYGTASGNRNFNFYVYHDAANLFYFHYSTPGSAILTGSVALTTGTWFIAAVTQDATTTKVYLNGTLIYSVGGQTLNQYSASGQEAVAKADNYWYGDIAVCALYSRALSAAEVLNNYNAFSSRVGLSTSTIAKRESSSGTLYVNNQFDEFTGAPVVDSSLQLWLDAGQTASYPGSGTTWTNLANASINTTLVNSPTFNTFGWITLDGTTQYGNTGFPGATTFTTDSEFSIACWVNFTAYKAASASIGTMVGAFNYQGYGLYWNGTPTTYTIGSYMRYVGTISNIVSSAVTPGTWYYAVQTYSRSGNSHKLYINGTLSASTTSISGAYNTNLNSVYIGIGYGVGSDGTPGGVTAGTPLNGSVSQSMIYNRALSADEVAQNFNALRRRYSL